MSGVGEWRATAGVGNAGVKRKAVMKGYDRLKVAFFRRDGECGPTSSVLMIWIYTLVGEEERYSAY